MPAIIIERPECKEEMWKALKRHIIRSRQKKKEELEEEEAEEMRRKLREEQYQKERMTLGETRSQLRGSEIHLAKLRDEKHQLFLQLKKVLNEESASRRKRFAEMSETYWQKQSAGTSGSAGHQQQLVVQPHNSQAPAPPRHLYKVGHVSGELIPSQEVLEDSHRGLGEYGGRAVLWNKSQTYSSTSAPGFYTGHHSGPMYNIVPAVPVPSHHVTPPSTAPPASATILSALTTMEREKEREREREQREQRERERERERDRDREEPPASKPYVQFIPTVQTRPPHPQYQDKFHSVRPASHVPIHGGAIPIQQPPQGAKTGSITSGYPVRSPAPPATQQQHASPHASPQPPPRPTTFQAAGPIISAPQVSIYPTPHRLMCIPTTSAPSGLGHLQTHPGGHGAGPSHPSNHPPSIHAPSHPPPHSASHTSGHATNHAPSHPSNHALSHSLPGHHSSHGSHPSHVISHQPSHGGHPIHSLGHTSVLHPPQALVNVSQGHQHQAHQGPPSRFTMSSMPRES